MEQSTMIFGLSLLLLTSHAAAADLGFRYQEGRCVNSRGQEGLNPSFLGPCSDMRGTVIRGVDLKGIDFSGSRFNASELQKISFEEASLVGVQFELAVLTEVNFGGALIQNAGFQKAVFNKINFEKTRVQNSDFSNALFTDTNFSNGIFTSCLMQKVNFSKAMMNETKWLKSDLRQANVAEARGTKASFAGSQIGMANFVNATFDQSDFSQTSGVGPDFSNSTLSGANFSKALLPKAQFRNANLKSANLQQADLSQSEFNRADLTDATYDGIILQASRYTKRTVLPFPDERAREFGMNFVKTKQVFALWDTNDAYFKAFTKALQDLSKDEIEVTPSTMHVRQFSGQVSLSAFDAVIFFVGAPSGYAGDLPENGQKAIVKFVQDGGVFISGEWLAYLVSNGYYKFMRDLILFQRQSGMLGTMTMTVTEEGKRDPIFSGISSSINLSSHGRNVGPVVTFEQNPVKVLAIGSDNYPAVASRSVGQGQVVAFNFACTNSQATCLNDMAVRQVYTNAILNR